MKLHFPELGWNVELLSDNEGYFTITLENIASGTNYLFSFNDGAPMPDPSSNFQPAGVHGPSQVFDHMTFPWTDQSWKGIAFNDLIMSEIHVGTFTPEGTFEAIIPRLKDLVSTGINAIELMPVAQFPGNRNWGYDGVFPYAVQNSYGGPEGLKKLVDACHHAGIAVLLDVVYNHLGPEGNYFKEYGPYFTSRYSTPWGEAINFDDAWSDGVREYFCNNALYWLHHYHLDGLRLDAVHMIFDNGAVHFLQHLNDRVRGYQETVGRPLHMIAESDLNSPRVIRSSDAGGHGLTAQWLDDFHHALYVLLDSKGRERYEDFGSMTQLAKAFKDGFVHSGEYVRFRKRRHGISSAGIDGRKFVAFISNHDQIGNRPDGKRISVLIDFERLKLAAATLILSPYIPMLFMGEEYGDERPFFYFISHSDPVLIEAVRKGRQEEFRDFQTKGQSPDAQDEETFRRCILEWDRRNTGHHEALLSWHRTLIALRTETPALKNFSKNDLQVVPIGDSGLAVHRWEPGGKGGVVYFLNFAEKGIDFFVPRSAPVWEKVLDSNEKQWNKYGAERSCMPATLNGGATVTAEGLSAVVYKARS
jgi:maltooligosyltrehalose trehalohydrolase